MKSIIAITGLASLAAAAPLDEPVRVLPSNWNFTITSVKGPGCPDLDSSGGRRTTRLTYGENTLDGSEDYWWYIAYPETRVKLGDTESVWCETEVAYQEINHEGNEAADYQFRLHKKGTNVISTYDLEDGVKATFKFEYLDVDAVDTLTLEGPIASGQYQKQNSMVAGAGEPVKVDGCGSTTLKFRTELSISGEGDTSFVQSEESTSGFYGVQFGFSYDWQKC